MLRLKHWNCINSGVRSMCVIDSVTVFSESRLVSAWVRVRDAGGHAAEVPLAVRVSREPVASEPDPPEYFLRESAAPGTLVARVSAPPGTRFRVADGSGGVLTVDETGAVRLAAELDRERAVWHHAAVVLERAGAAHTTLLRLHVLDDNDNAPRFHSHPYRLSVAENTPPHSTLLQGIVLLPSHNLYLIDNSVFDLYKF